MAMSTLLNICRGFYDANRRDISKEKKHVHPLIVAGALMGLATAIGVSGYLHWRHESVQEMESLRRQVDVYLKTSGKINDLLKNSNK